MFFCPCHTNFHIELSRTILLPFLCSVASNGTCGFSKFSSSAKEFLQMQCQTIWSMKCTKFMEITSNKLFFSVWAQLFCWTQRNTFWISFLKTGNLASSEFGGNLIISNQQKHIWRKPGQKVSLQSKSKQSLIAGAQQEWLRNTHPYWNLFGWSNSPETRSLGNSEAQTEKNMYIIYKVQVYHAERLAKASILKLWSTVESGKG